MKQIINTLKQSKRVVVATHMNPDGDALGSLVAMGLALDSIGTEAVLYNESPIPAVYRFIKGTERIVRCLEDSVSGFDTALILDCGSLERVGAAAERIARIPLIINVDHHDTNTDFGDMTLVDTAACASAELVYRMICALDVKISPAMAMAIYTGILTDTGSFRFSNTNSAAFEICGRMIDCGVDPYAVSQQVYGQYSMGRLKLLNLALDSIEISTNGKLSMMSLTQEMMDKTGAQPEDVDGFINYARRLQDVKVAVLIQEQKNGYTDFRHSTPYHVSLRSDGSVDVGAIAADFGGGGHASAAGFSLNSSFDGLKSKILQLANSL